MFIIGSAGTLQLFVVGWLHTPCHNVYTHKQILRIGSFIATFLKSCSSTNRVSQGTSAARTNSKALFIEQSSHIHCEHYQYSKNIRKAARSPTGSCLSVLAGEQGVFENDFSLNPEA